MKQVTALLLTDDFTSTNDANDSFDDRSDDTGPEPEGVAIGKVKGRQFAFVALERTGGVIIFDVTDPAVPRYVSYTSNRNFLVADVANEDTGDLGPKALGFIHEDDSPTARHCWSSAAKSAARPSPIRWSATDATG